jgi:excisionase family DNA binding protein
MEEKTTRDRPIRPSGLMTVPEAAEYLGVSRHTIYEWKAMRILAHVKLGRKLMFRQRDLDEFIERCWVPAKDGYALPGQVRKSRLSPITARSHPRGLRRPLEKRSAFRFFHSQPSARRHLLKVWGRARKGYGG